MFKSFLIVSLRNIILNKNSSWINIGVLVVGMLTSFLIFHYVHFHHNFDSLYGGQGLFVFRAETHFSGTNLTSKDALTSSIIGPTLKKDNEQIANYARLEPFSEEKSAFFSQERLGKADRAIYIETVYYTDSSVLDIIPINLLEGCKPNPLMEPNSILISESQAQKIFKDEFEDGNHIIGLTLKSTGNAVYENEYTIAGLFKDLPTNTHLKIDALVSKSFVEESRVDQRNVYTYVTSHSRNVDRLIHKGFENGLDIHLVPVQKIHLQDDVSNNPESNISSDLLNFLMIIGVIIMLLAVMNYTNNAILNSLDRAKEVGVRKLLGTRPIALLVTFMSETLLINVVSIFITSILFVIGIKFIFIYSGVDFPSVRYVEPFLYAKFLTVLIFSSTLLAGGYPAFYLSRLSPIAALQSKLQFLSSGAANKSGTVLKILTVVQVSVAIAFLAGTGIVNMQLAYSKQQRDGPKDLEIAGIFPGSSGSNQLFTSIVSDDFRKIQEKGLINEYSYSNLNRGKVRVRQSLKVRSSFSEGAVFIQVIDNSYWDEKEEPILAGINFNSVFGSNPDQILINESAMKVLGFSAAEDAIGDTLVAKNGSFEIIGIVSDKASIRSPSIFVTGFRYPTYVSLNLHYPGLPDQNVNQFLGQVQYDIGQILPFFSLMKREYEEGDIADESLLTMFFMH